MSDNTISRRDFLKLIGYGTVALSLAPFLNFGGLGKLKELVSNSAFAQSAGSWILGPQTTVVAIHAALLSSGKVFYLAGSGYHNQIQTGPYEARILDVSSGSEQNYQQSEDLFCIGLTGLPDGSILLAGGTLLYDINVDNCNGNWHGLNAAYEVNGSSESVNKVSSMAHGRWYPTCITLPDGKVMVVNGLDEYGAYNRLVEIYDPVSKSWSKSFDPNSSITYCVGAGEQSVCPGAGSPCYGGSNSGVAPGIGLYPRMHLMPSGLVITCGEEVTVRSWDPSTGVWSILTQTSTYRSYGTSFLLPLNNIASERGKILIVGGNVTPESAATRTVEILDFNAGSSTNPVVRTVASLSKARKFLLPIILPNGNCVVFGGYDPGTSSGVYTNIPEMFDPVAETWTNLPTASVQRGYHGVALLLPDGRVWTAGNSTPNNPSAFELATEIFSPGYFFQTRPTISGTPTVGNYGGTITIPTPDAATINSVSLVRLGAATHHYDPNARLVWLQLVSSTSSSVTVSAPINSRLAPPGYYMIHVLKGGVPSIAKIIKIPGSAPPDTTPPAQVAGLSVTAVSSTQLNLSWTANTEPDLNHYNVYRGTTAGFPVTLGTTTPVATPNTSPYSNTGLSPSTTYYYKVSAVDNAGNIGPLSTEQPGTTNTAADTTPPAQVAGLSVTAVSSTQLNLSWTANTEPDLNHYNVYRGTTAGFPVTLGTTTPVATPNISPYSNTGLSPSTTYYYKVSAVDNAGNIGPLSTERSGTTATDTTPPSVAITSPANNSTVGSSTVAVAGTSADAGSGVKQVAVRIRAGTTATASTVATPTAPNDWSTWSVSMNLSSAGPTGPYILEARAADNANNVQWSNDVIVNYSAADTTPPAQVAGLSVTAVSSTQLNLSWTANTEPDLNHYNVYRGTTAGFPVTLGTTTPVATPNTSPYSNTGLSPSTTYYYKVSAVDNAGNIGTLSAERFATTSTPADTTPPAQVAGLSVTAVSSTQLNLSWTANTEPDLNHYNVYRGTTAGFPVTLGTTTPVATPNTSPYSNTGLSPSTTYYYKVSAVDNAGNIGPLSTEQPGTTNTAADTTPPAQVAGLSVTAVSSTQLNLSWTANTEPDLNHYNVYRGTTAGFPVTLGTTTPVATPNTSPYSNTGLSPSTTYYYKVSAVDNAGNIGPLSTERSGTTATDTTPPSVAITSPANNSTVGSCTVAVAGTSADAGSGVKQVAVRIRAGTTATASTIATPTAPNDWSTWSLSMNLSSAGPTGPYILEARAADNANNVQWSNDVIVNYSAADTTPPAQVAGLSVTAVSSTQLNLSWTANTEPDLNHYNVYRGTTAGFPVTLGTTTPVATPNTSPYSNTGLSPSTTYYYKVSAVDNAGNIGPLSTERSGTTSATDTTPPSVAITSPANNSTVGSYTVAVAGTSADAGSGVKQVAVRIRAGTTATAYTVATPTAPNDWSTWSLSMNLSSAGPTGPYILEARAADNANNVQWSNDVIVNYLA